MSDTFIRVENVSKPCRLGEVGTGSLAHDVNRWWRRVRGKEGPYAKVGQTNDRTQAAGESDYSWALQGVSFEVRKGEVLGIIGRNGAGNQAAGQPLGRLPKAARRGRRRGKARINSTLLKILSRVTTQTEGRISRVRAGDRSWKVADRCNQADGRPRGRLPQGSPKGEMSGSERINGQIASLLEVGTGFHPELTGRENIFLNGAILGMRKPEPERRERQRRLPQAGPKGFAIWDKRKPNFDRGRSLGGRRRGIPKKMPGENEGCRWPWPHDSLELN